MSQAVPVVRVSASLCLLCQEPPPSLPHAHAHTCTRAHTHTGVEPGARVVGEGLCYVPGLWLPL